MTEPTICTILTDVEGTTSSIAYVKETLFPYAASRLATFLREHSAEPEVAAAIEETRSLAGDAAPDLDGVIALLQQWIAEDRKASPLKALQGLIWTEGFSGGALVSDVYPDAADGLRRWHRRGLKLYVYSSGSVLAQKNVFGHTPFGDLTPLFSGYFDTTIGAKVEARSYAAIAEAIGAEPGSILFLTDQVREADAAVAAGLMVTILDRGEAIVPADQPYPKATDFDGVEVLWPALKAEGATAS